MELRALSASSRRTASVSFVSKRHILHECLLLNLLLDLHLLGVILLHLLHLFFAMYITTFLAIRRRTLPTPIGRTPGFLLSGINRLAVNASKLLSVCEFKRCMLTNVLRNLLWIFKDLRDLSQIDWKPRFSANYLWQDQMGHILFCFLLLLSLLNIGQCPHKQYCVFVFFGPCNVAS